jgi:5-methylcytosine-specific restriction endonuclease McrA
MTETLLVKCQICYIEYKIPKIVLKYIDETICGPICRAAFKKGIKRSKKEFPRGHSRNRARKIIRGDKIDHLAIYNLHNWICIVCDEEIDSSLKNPHGMSATIDHVIPLSNEGCHSWEQVAPCHLLCNVIKNDRNIDGIVEKLSLWWSKLEEENNV